MATWVTHFRIAEELIKRGLPVSILDFLVGNIGPDCGLVNEDGKFTPPKQVTHFMEGREVRSELFFQQYELNKLDMTSAQGSYYLGYYLHLITDEEWIKLTQVKKNEQVHQAIIGTPEYNHLVKRDWYWLDFKYLRQNRNHIFWTVFRNIQGYSEYLPFFSAGQTFQQIQNITNFYCNTEVPEDYDPVYMKEAEVDDFVQGTVNKIQEVGIQRIGWNFSI
ncbi:hypothetical protein ASG89_34455 [Paenibacillus sp. Soil766]|uniref:zinc dependent phospholipase C family protein n=1 Tax=Paenibacillus sp. Soil766 TaxID=1736404 RepID=UPI00070AC94D|nr:zinc dependent phospholipase C family protein [Paenibacillus sp. Soil766]KRE91144.1 hypothetical protein ASG89_34455 [Paenibacillus sp. Soil766]